MKMCRKMPARWILSLMGLLGVVNLTSLRINLSSSIVDMVSNSSNIGYHHEGAGNLSSSHTQHGFSWNANEQGLTLGSYFYGYTISQVFGAWCGRRFGRVRVIGVSAIMASLLTILNPVLLNIHFWLFVAARICIGAFAGTFYPIMHGLWGIWSPPEERGGHLSIQYAGLPLAAAVIYPVCGYIAEKYGWQYTFYCTGALGLLWSGAWLLHIYDNPADNPNVTHEEAKKTSSSIGEEVNTDRTDNVKWSDILKSIPVWSIILSTFLDHMPSYLYLLLPTFLHDTYNLNVQQSSMLSSIPYVVKIAAYAFVGLLDWCLSKRYEIGNVRKAVNLTGYSLAALSLIIMTQVTGGVTITLLCFCIQESAATVSVTGIKASAIDIAPGFSGVVFALANSAGSIMGFLTPQYAGALREAYIENPNKAWEVLYLTAAACYILATVIFLLLGSGKVQQWAKREVDDTETTGLIN